jgi:hypothetical protein
MKAEKSGDAAIMRDNVIVLLACSSMTPKAPYVDLKSPGNPVDGEVDGLMYLR